MADPILISICVPAYKRTDFLKRLLDSIALQSFRDFEVVLTDDSPDESVKELCGRYENHFLLNYHRNFRNLGTPENWNEAIRKARGKWIKLMHDDDWFSGADSLQFFADAVAAHPDVSFIFCAYRNVGLCDDKSREIFMPRSWASLLKKKPAILFAGNRVGPPSVVLHRREPGIFYDSRLKWLVDIDFYIRYLEMANIAYIGSVLVNIGISDAQVTGSSFQNRKVEIPESFLLFSKAGWEPLRNIRIFDAWWRLMRNLGIRREGEIRESGYDGEIPAAILAMIHWQQKIPRGLLKAGPLSKLLMAICYLRVFSGQDS